MTIDINQISETVHIPVWDAKARQKASTRVTEGNPLVDTVLALHARADHMITHAPFVDPADLHERLAPNLPSADYMARHSPEEEMERLYENE